MPLFHHSFNGTTPGETWSFNIHTTGAGSLASAQAGAVAAANAFWVGHFDALTTADVSITEVATASLDEATDRQISRLSDAVVHPGTATGQSLPPQVALGVSWKTQLATRAGQGRIYLPPMAVSLVFNERANMTAVNGVVAGINAFWAALNTAGLQLVVRGKTSHVSTPVTRGNVGNVFDTQRRRRNKLVEVRTALTAP